MTRLLNALIPRSLAGQLIALTIAGLFLTQIIMIWMLADDFHRRLKMRLHDHAVARITGLTQVLSDTDRAQHGAILDIMSTGRERFHLGLPPRAQDKPTHMLPRLTQSVQTALDAVGQPGATVSAFNAPPRASGRRIGRAFPVLVIAVELEDGTAFHTILRQMDRQSVVGRTVLLTTLVTALVLAILLILAARRISEPLRDLAKAADQVGTASTGTSLTERGPRDVRQAISAFNRMDQRLTRLLDHQRRMIAAVGHDLRTPITALRLRMEFIEDKDNKAHMDRILDEMQTMTEGILALVRSEVREEIATPTDLGALIDSVCADFSDLGANISCAAQASCIVTIRTGALTRVLRNLIENAIRYGGNARVCLQQGAPIRILIEDDGPGIQADGLNHVFEPFVRLEESRNQDTGGLGLGLTIAQGLMEQDGGRIVLANRPEGGLRATILLPPGATAGSKRA